MHGAAIKTLIRGTAGRSLKLIIHPITVKVKNEWSQALTPLHSFINFTCPLTFHNSF